MHDKKQLNYFLSPIKMTSDTSNAPRVLESSELFNLMFPVGSTMQFLDESQRSEYYTYVTNAMKSYGSFEFEKGQETETLHGITIYYVKRTK